jgi:hypothetical protein
MTMTIKGKLSDVKGVDAPGKFMPFFRRMQVPQKHLRPGFAYRVTRNTPEDIDYREAVGWTTVTEKTSVSGQPDGRVVIAGKYVLQSMPTEQFNRLEEVHRVQAFRALRGPEEQFRGKAEAAGFEVVSKTRMHRGPMSDVVGEPDRDD